LDKAHAAWQLLQQETGTVASQKAMKVYDRAVVAIVKSMRRQEGTAAWGKAVQLSGAKSWKLTFDTPTRHDSAQTIALSEFAHCWVASDVKLSGFDRVVAHGGLGLPVVLAQDDPLRATRPFHPPKGEFLPATAVLEFPQAAKGHAAEAKVRFYDPLAVKTIKVGRHSLPMAENLTAAMQFTLTDSTIDENGADRLAPSASGEDESKLFFLNRYDRTKVPVVFVHGLRTGPVVWKNTVNALLADPELRRRYQPVCFVYPSGLPIPTSAARLRELLKASRKKLDPDHGDAAFDRVVLVGHSMGGLLTRMQVIDSGKDFWRSFFAATPEKLAGEVDAKTHRLMKKSLFFERLPNVRTVVFISTPHQGSELADNGILQTMAKFILFLPKTARVSVKALTELPPALINPTLRSFQGLGVEGVETLSTKHPYFHALTQLPIRVPFHSIISTLNPDDYLNGTDGVVPYWSSHLTGAESEKVIPYPHGSLEKPGAVQAVMTILKGKS
jgi:triacylglycerol esterase/lipase EstA (alpha/beta hydrolase family)